MFDLINILCDLICKGIGQLRRAELSNSFTMPNWIIRNHFNYQYILELNHRYSQLDYELRIVKRSQ